VTHENLRITKNLERIILNSSRNEMPCLYMWGVSQGREPGKRRAVLLVSFFLLICLPSLVARLRLWQDSLHGIVELLRTVSYHRMNPKNICTLPTLILKCLVSASMLWMSKPAWLEVTVLKRDASKWKRKPTSVISALDFRSATIEKVSLRVFLPLATNQWRRLNPV